jgi:hypothetical protein
MAFSNEEKRQIRSFLGYSGGFRDNNVRLESMFDVIGARDEEAAYARVLLGLIADVDDALSEVGTSTEETGALKQVDEIHWHPISETSSSTSDSAPTGTKWGEVLIERLRALFDVPLGSRYFRRSPLDPGPFPLG